MGEATAGLELWTSPAVAGKGDGESVAAAAARLSAEFSSVQDEVRGLQESLAKVGERETLDSSRVLEGGRNRDMDGGEEGGGVLFSFDAYMGERSLHFPCMRQVSADRAATARATAVAARSGVTAAASLRTTGGLTSCVGWMVVAAWSRDRHSTPPRDICDHPRRSIYSVKAST